jgi:2'-5' RNA ligase
MAKEGLYMLAVMPPPDLTTEIEEIRLQFATAYNCKAALKPPVHITLIPPFKTADTIEAELINNFDRWASKQESFTVDLKNYDVFRRNQVVFIHVEPSLALRGFQKELQDRFKQDYSHIDVLTYKDYSPHITIGYRDIPRELFRPAAIEYLAKYFSASFLVTEFYLWKHNTINWQVLHAFSLKSNRLSC